MRVSLNDFRVGWRLLLQEPIWSAVVVAGLAVGFAACFLLLGYVRYSFSYDQHLPENEQIYLVKTRFHFPGVPEQWSPQAPLTLRNAVAEGGFSAAVTMFADLDTSMRVENKVVSMPVSLVDSGFPVLFGIEPRAGDLKMALGRPDALALTEESALRLFGATDVVGKAVTIRGAPYTVAAVLPTPPQTTTLTYAALAGSGSNLWQSDDREDALHNWGRLFGRVYLKPNHDADPATIAAALQAASDRSPLHKQLPPVFLSQLGDRKLMNVQLGRLSDVYLDPDLAATAKPTEHGNRESLWGLTAIALLILLLACVNYVNLATVRTLRRQREIGVRKVLGASVGRVALQFIGESVLVALFGTAAGLLLAWLLLPVFADVMNRRLDGLFTPGAFAACGLLALAVGALAGAYPAWVATRVRPTEALAGRDNRETSSGLWVRRVLTVTQFATAMALTGVTLAIAWQTWHVSRLDPGFNADSLLVIDVAPPFTPSGPRTAAFAAAVGRLPGVAGAALSMEAVGRSVVVQKATAKREGGTVTTVEKKGVGVGYFDVYGIKPLAGQVFTKERDGDPLAAKAEPSGVVLSATAVRGLGFITPEAAIGQSIDIDGKGTRREVIGVVPDIRHQSPRELPAPVMYTLSRFTPVLSVRVSGDTAEVQHAIEVLWPQFFQGDALRMARARTFLSARYADDLRLAKLLAAAASIAITIAAFSIYVLSAYAVQRQTREIVLRKLHGAGGMAITQLVCREFAMVTMASAVIGLSAAAVAIQRYMAAFVDRAPVIGGALAFTLAVSVLIAFMAVLRHTSVAVRLRPTDALRG